MLAVLGIAITLALGALDQNITQVAVTGRFQRVSPVEVEQAVKARVRDMGLVSVDLAAVRRAVEQLPWVDSATVERQWPRALNIRVTEQVAAARWGANGLLNTRGELFISEARHIPPELPRLSGPHGSEGEVARRYLAAQGQLIEAGMRLTAVRLDARGAWEFDLDNGITVRLGRRQIDERFERFVRRRRRPDRQRTPATSATSTCVTRTALQSAGARAASASRPAAPRTTTQMANYHGQATRQESHHRPRRRHLEGRRAGRRGGARQLASK